MGEDGTTYTGDAGKLPPKGQRKLDIAAWQMAFDRKYAARIDGYLCVCTLEQVLLGRGGHQANDAKGMLGAQDFDTRDRHSGEVQRKGPACSSAV